MKYLFILIFAFPIFSYNSLKKPLSNQKSIIKNDFKKNSKKTIKNLIEVVKNEKSLDEWQWLAISSLARLTQVKSTPLLIKYTQHKEWNIRLAALKSLIALKYKEPKVYAALLKDKSMIVRIAALEGIQILEISKLTPNIWNMFGDKKNYVQVGKDIKRSEILSLAIESLSKFKSKKTKERLIKILRKSDYEDLWDEVDQVLRGWSRQKVPGSNVLARRSYWLSKQNTL